MRTQQPHRPLSALALAFLIALALAACGQRGPLFLPDDDKAAQPASEPTSEPASQADEDELEDDDVPPQRP